VGQFARCWGATAVGAAVVEVESAVVVSAGAMVRPRGSWGEALGQLRWAGQGPGGRLRWQQVWQQQRKLAACCCPCWCGGQQQWTVMLQHGAGGGGRVVWEATGWSSVVELVEWMVVAGARLQAYKALAAVAAASGAALQGDRLLSVVCSRKHGTWHAVVLLPQRQAAAAATAGRNAVDPHHSRQAGVNDTLGAAAYAMHHM
jgi:hypothetical protein